MTALYLYDDHRARAFAPFALTRPLGELRAGAVVIRERWEAVFGLRAVGALCAPHLASFQEGGAPPAASDVIPAGAVIASTRCVASLETDAGDAEVWTCGDAVAAVRLDRPVRTDAFDDGARGLDTLCRPGARTATIAGRWLDDVWSFIADLVPQLRDDLAVLARGVRAAPPAHAIVLGAHGIHVDPTATIEPSVCFDVQSGPVLVSAGATVRAFTRLMGPCWIGPGVTILGDRVHACAIGDGSTIRGEISETIVLGNANKTHDGFVGHSYLGRWVNLGAGTITSNLKNTYGTVQLWTPAGVRDTGLVKLGSFFGDHVKTGIGTRLTTGCVVGAGSNVYGSRITPKYIAPFSWGEAGAFSIYRLDKFLETAERAMARRGIALSDAMRRQFADAHARAASDSP